MRNNHKATIFWWLKNHPFTVKLNVKLGMAYLVLPTFNMLVTVSIVSVFKYLPLKNLLPEWLAKCTYFLYCQTPNNCDVPQKKKDRKCRNDLWRQAPFDFNIQSFFQRSWRGDQKKNMANLRYPAAYEVSSSLAVYSQILNHCKRN